MNTSPSIAVKQISIILITSLFFTCMVLVPAGTAHATGNAVKWHPGHYYAIMEWGKNDPAHLAQVYSEILTTPALRGIQIRYTWAELEPNWGVYDFTSIDQRLAELAALGKRLIILLDTKTYNTDTFPVPDYVRKERFEWGSFAFSGHNKTVAKGYSTKLWNPHVHDRLVELISKLGEHYNAHPYFEGIGLSETSMGHPINALSNIKVDDYYNNLLSLNQHMRRHFPNTMTYQNTNHPRWILEKFASELKNMGTALGGPDTYIEDPSLNLKDQPYTPDGVYSYYAKLSGIVPLTPSVMHKNYTNTRHDDRGYNPTVPELLSFARNTLKANYIFWTRAPKHYEEVLQVLNWRAQTKDPAGGLDSACPAAYSSCVD
ncbi:MAG: beta-galactosidase [Nitrosomonas sp.]|nr:beta-galactosidase [Nitrosomonas sp.]